MLNKTPSFGRPVIMNELEGDGRRARAGVYVGARRPFQTRAFARMRRRHRRIRGVGKPGESRGSPGDFSGSRITAAAAAAAAVAAGGGRGAAGPRLAFSRGTGEPSPPLPTTTTTSGSSGRRERRNANERITPDPPRRRRSHPRQPALTRPDERP
jgi:hypothetical protein